jgi:1,4-dihydroxy-2-naphthoate octaprenyltransferase
LLLLVLLGALLAHISVNALNEYSDFKSGLDLATTRTPFSGGSGALPENPEMSGAVFAVGAMSLMATLTIGGFFIWKYGAGIVPIGVTGLILIVTYTDWINRYPFLCLVAPGIGFGFLMVVGTQFVLQGEYVPLSVLVAIIPFFLVNNLLLLNQYPDIVADASVGRNHFPIAYGVSLSNLAYALFALATTASIIIMPATKSAVSLAISSIVLGIPCVSEILIVFQVYSWPATAPTRMIKNIGPNPSQPASRITLLQASGQVRVSNSMLRSADRNPSPFRSVSTVI